jgi:hypothetical protein
MTMDGGITGWCGYADVIVVLLLFVNETGRDEVMNKAIRRQERVSLLCWPKWETKKEEEVEGEN